MAVTVHSTPRIEIEADLLQRWRAVPPAVAADLVHDRYGNPMQIDPAIGALRPAGQQPTLFGRAVTVRCHPPDFGAMLYAVDFIATGDVLVIAAEGQAETAMIGEILCGHIKRKGGIGIVCDGAIRDVGQIAKLDGFAAYARHVTPRGPTGAEQGSVNVPVTVGGRLVSPGDLIIGDDDGLVALSIDTLQNAIAACEDKLAKEITWQSKLSSGQTMVQTFDLPKARTVS